MADLGIRLFKHCASFEIIALDYVHSMYIELKYKDNEQAILDHESIVVLHDFLGKYIENKKEFYP